ncbi:hypothetical protein SAMN05660653_00796 [Desulfonatronum thiosulfatophilum]|uniref:Uncharacterized protein n=1 Tax=Desulfonatronum thiosulfatophilum TaxID=617002 RepID=A0A1G6B8S2_9BACT|nr:hypothetical protein [Desulfonatronum thiosulfatophilum]SDB16959.1 hypothetical protein SAMN05660653_00796 [Desulfonatronum thiosulfatophilum]
MSENSIIHAFDASGKRLGVFIPSSLWDQLDNPIKNALANPVIKPKQVKEPIADWETLVACWDFPYPVDKDVNCQHCGITTEDWQHDTPRKFHLKAANLGGLVSFECCACHARIRKNHFKDVIEVSCTPPND